MNKNKESGDKDKMLQMKKKIKGIVKLIDRQFSGMG